MVKRLVVIGMTLSLAHCGNESSNSKDDTSNESCSAGDQYTRLCGTCGTQARKCIDGTWGNWGDCIEPASCSITCESGDKDERECGACGIQQRPCVDGAWGAWGTCVEPETCNCATGDVYARNCGNCGRQQRACSAGSWGQWEACQGEGECGPDEVGNEACGTSEGACEMGTRSRTCSASCTWGTWTECGGSYVGPSAEKCGDNIDNNCNGRTDEGCSCSPAAPGSGGSFVVTGQVAKLVADPARCFLYGLNTGDPSQVIVFDIAAKNELSRITLPQQAHDIDISPNGAYLVVAHDAIHQISTIDLSTFSVAATIPVQSDPYRLEVDNNGVVYYIELDQWVDIHRIDLAVGLASDTILASWAEYQGDIELSTDGIFLFVGESGISGGKLTKYNVSGGGFTQVDQSIYADGYGFPYPDRHVYLSPGAQHVYYADHQISGDNLAFIGGQTGEKVFTENTAGTFAVGETSVIDTATLRVVASLTSAASAAALVNEETELWYYSGSTARIHYANVEDFIGGVQLGQREFPAGPLSSYTLTSLARDPGRDRLYALDTNQDLVVVIEASSLTPTVAIDVGSTPTDLDVSLSGNYLYVGHLNMLAVARIDLQNVAFDSFVPTPRNTFEIEALANDRLIVIDEDQWTTPTLIDGMTGNVLGSSPWGVYEGALTATADGLTVFIGEANLSGSNITRYSVASGTLQQVDQSDYDDGYGFPFPSRHALALPNGSGVFYAEYLLDGADLSVLKYATPDTVLTVSPDGRLAITDSDVFGVSDGTHLGALTTTGSIQAISPDSSTLYVVTGSGIATVNLSNY